MLEPSVKTRHVVVLHLIKSLTVGWMSRYAVSEATSAASIPSTLRQPQAFSFWFAIIVTGIGAGLSAAILTLLLQFVQRLMWPGAGETLLDAAAAAPAWRHVVILLAAGVLTGLGQLALVRLSSGNSIDITAAIWFFAGRMPALRTLGSAVLSIILVGMGASLGREGAPKQFGAVLANALADRAGFSDEQRRLLVACGSGAGMAAAYGVPLGGALFSLEVLRGMLALRLVLPALMTSIIACAVAWTVLPDRPTYQFPAFAPSWTSYGFAVLIGLFAAIASVGFVRVIAIAFRHRPSGTGRLIAPVIVLGLLGLVSIALPELLGNGKDIVQMALTNELAPLVIVLLLVLKPLATISCVGASVPGGLFTPSLAAGALLGCAIGHACSFIVPDVQIGLFALLGAGAFIAATTQGPISSIVLMIELTGHDRSLIAPLIVAVVISTVLARTIDPRSIYDARLNDDQLRKRQEMRDLMILMR